MVWPYLGDCALPSSSQTRGDDPTLSATNGLMEQRCDKMHRLGLPLQEELAKRIEQQVSVNPVKANVVLFRLQVHFNKHVM